MQIDGNTIIKCKSQTEVSTCLNMLKDLGFETFYEENDCNLLVAATFITLKLDYLFTSFETREISSKNNLISFETFQKLYNKQIEERKPNLLVDKNGKILKVNNINKKYDIFAHYSYDDCVKEYISDGDYIAMHLNTVDYYTSREACEKVLKRKETENKLKALAFELNGNRNITFQDWEDYSISKYYLCFKFTGRDICQYSDQISKDQGKIYCLSDDFKNKAINLIGEEDLKEYLING